MKRLAAIGALLCALACSALPPKPGCAPGWSAPIVAACKAEIELGVATLEECDARVEAKASGCLR